MRSQTCGRATKRRGVKENYSTINAEKTGKKIKALRERNNLTVRDLALLLCLPDGQMICEWEDGTRLPSAVNVVCLSDVLLVPIDEILARDQRERSPT